MIEQSTLVALIENARQARSDIEDQIRAKKSEISDLLRHLDALDEAEGRTLEGMTTARATQVALRALGRARLSDIAAYIQGRGLDRSSATVNVALHRLKSRGLVERTGNGWRITE